MLTSEDNDNILTSLTPEEGQKISRTYENLREARDIANARERDGKGVSPAGPRRVTFLDPSLDTA
jgi:hypothetical protein